MGATVQGMILGTAAYMAPEQAKGFSVDKRADIWAFGVVLYEMLSGRRLFEGELVSARGQREVRAANGVGISGIRPEVPDDLDLLVVLPQATLTPQERQLRALPDGVTGAHRAHRVEAQPGGASEFGKIGQAGRGFELQPLHLSNLACVNEHVPLVLLQHRL